MSDPIDPSSATPATRRPSSMWLAVALLCCVSPPVGRAENLTIPSWQRGVPTWNKTGYETSVMPAGDTRDGDQTEGGIAGASDAGGLAVEPAAAQLPIGSAISEVPVEAFDAPPLADQSVRWYQYPVRWMRGWDSHAEFGLNGSDGNADQLAIQTGFETKRQNDVSTVSLDLDYRKVTTRSATTEENGRFNFDYDRMLGDSPWAGFGKLGLEWDEFKAFDLRLNLNSGLAYHWIREDTATLITRFGAGASREFGAPVDEWTPEAVFGIEASRQINSRNKVSAKIDYFPSWEDYSDYRIVADASWEILLDEAENFSLKFAVNDRYDSTPQGFEANDLFYSALLLYKF